MKSDELTDPFFAGAPHDYAANEPRRITANQPRVIRACAHFFSVIFHPLFIPGYITAFLLFVHPYVFSGFSEKSRLLRLASVVLHTAFFPAFAVLLLKQLGFVQSIFLRTQKDRIIPYIISNFFYFWIFYVLRNVPDNPSPPVFNALLLGVFLASVAALMANIYFKISMHAIAMGSQLTFFIMLSMQGNFSMGIYLSVAMLIAGLVCTARLIISDHHPFEVYAGLFLGIISQTVAGFFV